MRLEFVPIELRSLTPKALHSTAQGREPASAPWVNGGRDLVRRRRYTNRRAVDCATPSV